MSVDRWHIIDLNNLGDWVDMEDLFPPSVFPDVSSMSANGDPLDGYPNGHNPNRPRKFVNPYDSDEDDDGDMADFYPLGGPIPLPLPGWPNLAAIGNTTPQGVRPPASANAACTPPVATHSVATPSAASSPPTTPLIVAPARPTSGLHLAYPYFLNEVTETHRLLAMAHYGYVSTGQVTLHDVQDMIELMGNPSTSSSSGVNRCRNLRPRTSDPDDPTVCSPTSKSRKD